MSKKPLVAIGSVEYHIDVSLTAISRARFILHTVMLGNLVRRRNVMIKVMFTVESRSLVLLREFAYKNI
jgi:hypothetical protein